MKTFVIKTKRSNCVKTQNAKQFKNICNLLIYLLIDKVTHVLLLFKSLLLKNHKAKELRRWN